MRTSLRMTVVAAFFLFACNAWAQTAKEKEVQVVNTAANPVPVTGNLGVAGTVSAKNVDEPGRIPYQQMVEFSPGGSGCSGALCLVPFSAVPAGKRLVIEHMSALLAVADGGVVRILAFGTGGVTNSENTMIIAPTFVNTGFSVFGVTFWAIDRPVKVYYEPGTTPTLKIIVSNNLGIISNASVHGYLIDAAN